ncbi:MAG TPA: VanW family protein [Gaiellaceae bacterium]|nr:VanW family protein [Gaiellaceae bacterium]
MRAEVDVRPVRGPDRARRRARTRTVRRGRLAGVVGGVALLALLAVGLVFAGSSKRLAAGVSVAGVEVSGLSPSAAEQKLSDRAAELADVPVTFTAGEHRWRSTAEELEVEVDWRRTIARAQEAGWWPPPVRGLKRIYLRLVGADVEPVASAYEAGLRYELEQVAATVGTSARDAAIEVTGQTARIVPGAAGLELDAAAARETVVDTLAGFSRDPVPLPVVTAQPDVTTEELGPALEDVRTALSAPVRFGWGDTRWTIEPEEIAKLLRLPAFGRTELEIGGSYATTYFERLAEAVDEPPKDARFVVRRADRSVRVRPARDGRVLDVEATSKALFAAVVSRTSRSAELVVVDEKASLTTEEAKALGITRELARYTTGWSGDADRVQNLRRAAELLNGTRIRPGGTFSFNEVVGERTLERGFRPAPVIVGGKYAVGVGGGVSQVATGVFNAAWEAGLPIPDRTAHALYISRYEAGRDATVNYPDIDLEFENDTGNWLVMQAYPTDAGIAVALLGVPDGRRVVTEAGPLRVVGPPKVKRVPDPGLFVGEKVVEDYGEPARAITVRRIVYQDGKVLYDENWYTYYRSEPKVVHVGTIPVPEPAPQPVPEPTPTPTEPTPTESTPTETTPTETGGGGTGETTTGRN